ncbi:TIGR03862 family flavoprotein [Rhodobacteraceae bacterium DSL-40]|uniref:TIGR03862 family flavoprotein n=1 Tax=Amaricoccus sp. B4 TaxID=3368557 RepID=UPI000DABB805
MQDPTALVIGGGPAGLMAAGMLAGPGRRVLIAEAMPSLGRKLLMAGKSGLNLTKDEPLEAFCAAYPEGGGGLSPMLADFGPEAVRAWADGLGAACFTGTSGRVFPAAMKASPLLRAWLAQLAEAGVDWRTRWRWTGWEGEAFRFETPEGPRLIRAEVTVLALGGASWPRLGSDAAWTEWLAARGVALAPFRAANVGHGARWSEHMAKHFGAAVKPVALSAGGRRVRGEFVVTARGVEGGGIYALGSELGRGATLSLDLLPDLAGAEVAARVARPRGRLSLANHLRRRLGLPPVKIALLRECAPEALAAPETTAAALKALPLPLTGPHPIAEAISSAGGVCREALDSGLMLHALPGVFCAGEMLDWDAPTGGYLLTACLATGRWAGRAAAARLAERTTG